MPFLQEVAPEILLVLFFINGMIAYGQYVENVPFKTPFDFNANVTASTTPQGFNHTSSKSIAGNLTGGVANQTTTNPIINAIQANVFAFFQYAYIFVQFISGDFIWNILGEFGMPAQLIYVFSGGILFLLGRTIYYYFTGK